MWPLDMRLYCKNHFLMRAPSSSSLQEWQVRGLSRASYLFALDILSNTRATHVVVAKSRNNTIGWFRFKLEEGALTALGTWVDKGYRKHQIAQSLWQKALVEVNPHRVWVDAVSTEGVRLVSSLQAKWAEKVLWITPHAKTPPTDNTRAQNPG